MGEHAPMGPIPEMEVTTFGPIVRLPTGLLNESSVNEIKGGGGQKTRMVTTGREVREDIERVLLIYGLRETSTNPGEKPVSPTHSDKQHRLRAQCSGTHPESSLDLLVVNTGIQRSFRL